MQLLHKPGWDQGADGTFIDRPRATEPRWQRWRWWRGRCLDLERWRASNASISSDADAVPPRVGVPPLVVVGGRGGDAQLGQVDVTGGAALGAVVGAVGIVSWIEWNPVQQGVWLEVDELCVWDWDAGGSRSHTALTWRENIFHWSTSLWAFVEESNCIIYLRRLLFSYHQKTRKNAHYSEPKRKSESAARPAALTAFDRSSKDIKTRIKGGNCFGNTFIHRHFCRAHKRRATYICVCIYIRMYMCINNRGQLHSVIRTGTEKDSKQKERKIIIAWTRKPQLGPMLHRDRSGNSYACGVQSSQPHEFHEFVDDSEKNATTRVSSNLGLQRLWLFDTCVHTTWCFHSVHLVRFMLPRVSYAHFV